MDLKRVTAAILATAVMFTATPISVVGEDISFDDNSSETMEEPSLPDNTDIKAEDFSETDEDDNRNYEVSSMILEPVHIKIASKIIAKVRFPKYRTSSLS